MSSSRGWSESKADSYEHGANERITQDGQRLTDIGCHSLHTSLT